jgi:hypothetical protein
MWGVENVCLCWFWCDGMWCSCSGDLVDQWGEEYLDGRIWCIVDLQCETSVYNVRFEM